jgi:hypothetical protein
MPLRICSAAAPLMAMKPKLLLRYNDQNTTRNILSGRGAGPGAAPAPVLVLRPMRPREVLFVLRSACGGDVRALCGDVPPGGGRILQCLASRSASLSPACMDAMSQFAAQ